MKKLQKQLSAITLSLMLMTNSVGVTVSANYIQNNVTPIEDGTEGDGTEGDGTDDTTPEPEVTIAPVLPTVNTNFGTVTRSYALNSSSVESLKITAKNADNGTLSYQWFINSEKITGETGSSYTPAVRSVGVNTYYCEVTNSLNGKTVTAVSDAVTIEVLQGSDDDDSTSSVDTPTVSEHYSNYISYQVNRPASELTIQINASRIESDSISYQWYKSSVNNTGSGTMISSGTLSPYSITTISVTPDTYTTGSHYYYCVITNTKDGVSKSVTSKVINVTVSTNNHNNDYNHGDYYNTQISSNGTITLGAHAHLNIDRSSLENYLSRSSNNDNITIYGSNIRSIRLPATLSYTTPYSVTVHDSGTGQVYTWKISNGTKVSSYLDLVVDTTTSVSNVNKSYTNLNYDPNYSQVLQFEHDGSLNTNNSTMLLQIPTTVSNGTVWLYKLSGKNILSNTELQANVSNGMLYANMQSCSDWLISANKLIDVTTNENEYYYNVKTDARLNIPQFQNVVIGGYLNLSTIDTNFFSNYRFEGWYFDTAYQYPVTGTYLTSLLITADLLNNGIYPKLTYYNTHVPETNFPVPSTNAGYLARLF